MNTEITLHQQLKKRTLDLHAKAHRIPYIANLIMDNIPLISYTGHLRSLAIIYGTLENQLFNNGDTVLKGFLKNYTPRLNTLLADLEFLKTNEEKDIIPAISNALYIADKIMINSLENPFRLLGYVYTLEGSINGGSILKKHVMETFKLSNNDGTGYFSCLDDNFKNFWEDFINKLNTEIKDDKQKEYVISGADEIFLDLLKVYESLYPIDVSKVGNHITSLNPEAGNYPISTNPLEIKGAINAGLNCWNEFPYYEKRYGERGRRFTVSDSVWLITLCELSEEDAIKQLDWLSSFLAIRGMPTYTMEIQMKFMYSELSIQILDAEQKYHKFLKLSEHISKQRNKYISDEEFNKCNPIFDKYFKKLNVTEDICNTLKPNTGKLIASCLVDDKNGIPGAKDSLINWLKSTELFPENWVQAVEKTQVDIENILIKN